MTVGLFLGKAGFAQDEGPDHLRVSLAQLQVATGDIAENFRLIREQYLLAVKRGDDLFVTPELALEGYPNGDGFTRPELLAASEAFFEELKELTRGKKTALLVGHIRKTADHIHGKPLQNIASALVDGEEVFTYAKRLLPTYREFEDWRHFEPGTDSPLWKFRGWNILVAICEDLWKKSPVAGRERYADQFDPLLGLQPGGVNLILSLSASTYVQGKQAVREAVHAEVARRLQAPLGWVAMTGATDGMLYDGRSFFLSAGGELVDRLPHFRSATGQFDVWRNGEVGRTDRDLSYSRDPIEMDIVIDGLVEGIRAYVHNTGHKGMLLGMSGGLDSSVVAVLAVLALGAENVKGYSLPSIYSSDHSKSDAYDLALSLGLVEKGHFETIPIRNTMAGVRRDYLENEIARVRKEKGRWSWKELSLRMSRSFGTAWPLDELASQNSQSRARALILNGLANYQRGYLVAGTSNKTEIAMGYYTQGGDNITALGIIADLWKTEVFALWKRLQERYSHLVPFSVFDRVYNKKASAELGSDKNQVTENEYGAPFDKVDAILRDYFEELLSVADCERKHENSMPDKEKGWVRALLRRAEIPEFKRKYNPHGFRVSKRSFDTMTEHRFPTAAKRGPSIRLPGDCPELFFENRPAVSDQDPF